MFSGPLGEAETVYIYEQEVLFMAGEYLWSEKKPKRKTPSAWKIASRDKLLRWIAIVVVVYGTTQIIAHYIVQ